MKKGIQIVKIWGASVTILFLMLSLTAATYAWFTVNRVVSTDRVNARSGNEELELQVSTSGGSGFRGSEEAAIVQINRTDRTMLKPVSTADLKTFLYNPSTINGNASRFRQVSGEEYYYHGRVYLRAQAQGQTSGTRMALYLDQSSDAGGNLAVAGSGQLLNAARLGLLFDNSNPVIFSLSSKANAASDQVRNTVIGGTKIGDNMVLTGTGGNVRQTKDPAVGVETYAVKMNGEDIVLPDRPLLYMEPGRIYTLDIYFYLEGCDPDCSNAISYDGADIHLAFYGVLDE